MDTIEHKKRKNNQPQSFRLKKREIKKTQRTTLFLPLLLTLLHSFLLLPSLLHSFLLPPPTIQHQLIATSSTTLFI